jgi:hypothetical protein
MHLDVEKIKDRDPTLLGGFEWYVAQGIALRGGYDGRQDLDNGLTAGLGLQVNESFEVDYGYRPYANFGSSHRFALTWSFGSPQTSTTTQTSVDEPTTRFDRTDPLVLNASTTNVSVGDTVRLTVEGTSDSVTEYHWSTPGGTTRTDSNILVHRFTRAGTTTVTAVARYRGGLGREASRDFRVLRDLSIHPPLPQYQTVKTGQSLVLPLGRHVKDPVASVRWSLKRTDARIAAQLDRGTYTRDGSDTLILVPKTEESGTVPVTLRLGNGLDTDVQTIQVRIVPPNRPPVIREASVTSRSDSTATIHLSAADAERNEIEYLVVSEPTRGSLGSLKQSETGQFVYVPSNRTVRRDTITVRATDGVDSGPPLTITVQRSPDTRSNRNERTFANKSLIQEVQRQQSLWYLSERRLRRIYEATANPRRETTDSDRNVSEQVVYRYWRDVINKNKGRLRSGDPDLIYPGEEIILPPIPEDLLPGGEQP